MQRCPILLIVVPLGSGNPIGCIELFSSNKAEEILKIQLITVKRLHGCQSKASAVQNFLKHNRCVMNFSLSYRGVTRGVF